MFIRRSLRTIASSATRWNLANALHVNARPLSVRLVLCKVIFVSAFVRGFGMPQCAAAADQGAVSTFDHEVMAVLSRAGCNQGACHGNLNGKGGLRLSLRGQDPDFDFQSLTHDSRGRRIDRQHPAESLVVRKPATEVPHEGGRRLIPGSHEYQLIVDWIRRGTPGPDPNAPELIDLVVSPSELTVRRLGESVRISATAVFDDGQRRDVTDLVAVETTNFVASVDARGVITGKTLGEASIGVRYLNAQRSVRVAFVAKSTDVPQDTNSRADHWIDRQVFKKLERLGLPRPSVSDDRTFVRRAYLDLLGRIPTAAEAKGFIEDASPNKRERLIDELLTHPSFADFWALKWSDLLRNEEKLLDVTGVERFHSWIRSAIAEGMPLDRFANELISARGSTYEHPPANFYRALRDPTVRAESAARLFLGVRLQCAKCHNHPFDRWKQDDYYAWARVFAGVEYEIVENKKKDRLDKSEFVGEQIISVKLDAPFKNARTNRLADAKFLGANSKPDPEADLLYAVADWTTRENRQFDLAQANRIWFHMMGRGLVNPVDDFRVTNPASHPELLNRLADELRKSGYQLRHLIRQIMVSKTYQAATIEDDERALAADNFSGIRPRRLSAEQLLDSQTQLLGLAAKFNGYESGIRAIQMAGVQKVRFRDAAPSEDDRFLILFGKPQRLMNCECERSDGTTLTQALYLISGPALHRRLESNQNRLSQWQNEGLDANTIVEQLFWEALSRSPSDEERRACRLHLDTADEQLTAMRDLAWALINAKEFLFRP